MCDSEKVLQILPCLYSLVFSGVERSPVVEVLFGNITLHIARQGFNVVQFLCQVNCHEIFTRVKIIKFAVFKIFWT
jgi:hypothetical protein